jgi:L-cysteine:1D-myo-inositol 2-amino-2-deoxy-alpha-D-glucopyranoside ligase
VQLFDTATRTVKTLTPRDGRVGMYVCGITPYEGGHVGHAFTFHTFDIIARRLRSQGITVRSVRNVTDVDDDILRVARERGENFRTLADVESRHFDADMIELGMLPVDASPRATTRVHRMVQWILRLVECGAAYDNEGWVYFDVDYYPQYGSLSRLNTTAMVELSRLRGADPDDPRKRNPLDFVLWQPSAEGEPSWPSPWSMGRPGWHIECTVLAATELSLPVDLHGGGDDLIYPHHESEIAQAVAAGVPAYTRHWAHVAMVGHHGEKMSKSLGNLVFISDLLKVADARAIRLALMRHHYRAGFEWYDTDLDEGTALLHRLLVAAARPSGPDPRPFADRVRAALDNDLDAPHAVEALDDLASAVLSGGDDPSAPAVLRELGTLIGVDLDRPVEISTGA